MNPWERVKAPLGWLAGLRIITARERRRVDAELRRYINDAKRAHEDKRETERLLVLLLISPGGRGQHQDEPGHQRPSPPSWLG